MHEETLDRLCSEACERNVPLLERRGEIIQLQWEPPPRPQASFGFIDNWVTVDDAVHDASATLFIPFQQERLGWVRRETLRLFRRGPSEKFLEKVNGALFHRKHSVVYRTLDRAGLYGLIGLHTHPLVRQTIRVLCEMKPIARTLPEPAQRALRDRVCEVILCARDLDRFWASREALVELAKSFAEDVRDDLPPLLPRSVAPGETICDRCRGIDILDLPECSILDEPLADRPSGDGPLGAGDFRAGFRLVADIPVSPGLQSFSSEINGVEFSTPAANAAIIFYPATADGENAPVAVGTFPLIIFGHAKRLPVPAEGLCPGAPADTKQDFRQVSGILAHLAQWGFVSIAPDISWLTLATAGQRQLALEDAGLHMVAENSRAGSPFNGRIRTSRMGAMGHSFGGLASVFVGVSGVLPIDAVGLIAPAAGDLSERSQIASFAPKPVLILHGTHETGSFGGVDDQPLSLFAAAAPTKHLVTIGGANHFGYTDAICFAGGAGGAPTISQGDQQRIAKAFLTAFFRRYLKNATGVSDYLSGARTIEGLEAFDITVEAQL